jgi:hypothetical protein
MPGAWPTGDGFIDKSSPNPDALNDISEFQSLVSSTRNGHSGIAPLLRSSDLGELVE